MNHEATKVIKNWRSLAALLVALLGGLSVNQALFQIASSYQAQVAEKAIDDLLVRNQTPSNPYLLGQSLKSLQDLHLIDCTTMSSKVRPTLADFTNLAQSESCTHPRSLWLKPNLEVHRTIHAGNGEEIEANYQIILGTGFALGLWGSRFLWVILIFVFWYAILTRLELQSAHARAVTEIAEQVSHDLVSPLATLNELLLEAQQTQIPEDLRFKLRSGIGKIRDIVNELKSRPSKRTNDPSSDDELIKRAPELLSAVIESLVSEKCTEFRSKPGVQIIFQFNREDIGLFSSINALKLQRILSNLINNSVQALKNEKGRIDVSLSKRGNGHVQIEVKDNGSGIPPEVLSKLGKRGQTFGRPKGAGSGLGLFDAKTTIENWAGEFALESPPGQGTFVRMILPKVPPPHWFLDSVSLRAGQRIVIVDDDSGIHGIWERRIAEIPHADSLELLHFHSARSFKSWYASEKGNLKPTSYFFDYELLGESENGLDLIESMSLAEQSALVTSRYDSPLIRERSNRLSVRILPKTMALFVPIVCSVPRSERPDAIFIDDDPAFLLKWSKSAKTHGKKLVTFSNAQSVLDQQWVFDHKTSFHVDADLGEDSGIALTEKLFNLGFQELHLATGYRADHFDLKQTPWIKSVRGKTPPWES